jgi:hypothetical protein
MNGRHQDFLTERMDADRVNQLFLEYHPPLMGSRPGGRPEHPVAVSLARFNRTSWLNLCTSTISAP